MAVISSVEHVKEFFTAIKSIGFFGRIFSWGSILKLHSLAQNEMQTLLREFDALGDSNQISKNDIIQLKRDLDHQKELFSNKSNDYEILKNTANIYLEDLSENDTEIGSLRSSEEKYIKRISELERDNERFQTSIQQFNETIQEKENEIGRLRGIEERNSKRIIELEKESERLQTSIQQFNVTIQEKGSEIGRLRGIEERNSKRIIELEKESERLQTSVLQLNGDIQEKESKIGALQESDTKNTRRIVELETDLRNVRTENLELERKITSYQNVEEQQLEQYNDRITELNTLKNQLTEDRRILQGEHEAEIKRNFEAMAETWRVHEAKVEEVMKGICSRHQIDYLKKEQVPFKGKPDNTIRICDEFVIFDAKSPQNDDLQNFSSYLKRQAEDIRKYVKEKDVYKSLFLVVPSNTIEKLPQYYHNMADYDVFIITLDTLEPIIMTLKRIESYEFAEQLSPEDRDNICRILGKFAHATKRRIQIDSYFCNEYINILNSCTMLPDEMMEMTLKYEKADKMNPPLERRAKLISEHELKKEVRKIKHEAESQEINTYVDAKLIEQVPLYVSEGEAPFKKHT